MKKHLLNIFLVLILLAGLSLLLYPTVSDYWNSFHQSRAISSYNAAVSNMDTEQYQEVLSKAKSYNRAIAENGMHWTMTEEEMQEYEETLDLGGGPMGYIEIPRIREKLSIYHGTSESVLQTGIGHVEGSSLPVGAESWTVKEGRYKSSGVRDMTDGSHCVLSGHRGLPSARLFTDLDKLVVGDTFTLTILNETLTYEVDQIRIVEPTDLSELTLLPGQDLCTLVTCTPYGINTHRLLVRGHRIANASGEASVAADGVQIETMYVVPFMAVPIVFVMLIITLVTTDIQKKHRDAYRNSVKGLKKTHHRKISLRSEKREEETV